MLGDVQLTMVFQEVILIKQSFEMQIVHLSTGEGRDDDLGGIFVLFFIVF